MTAVDPRHRFERIKPCAECAREGAAHPPARVERSATVGSRVFTMRLRGWTCTACLCECAPPSEELRFEEAVTRHLLRVGAFDGPSLAWLRQHAGLTTEKLGELFGLFGEAVDYWERGGHVDRGEAATVHGLARDALEGRSTTREALARLTPGSPVETVTLPDDVVDDVAPAGAGNHAWTVFAGDGAAGAGVLREAGRSMRCRACGMVIEPRIWLAQSHTGEWAPAAVVVVTGACTGSGFMAVDPPVRYGAVHSHGTCIPGPR